MVIEEFFEDFGSMRVRGAASFFPTAHRGESGVKVMFLKDRDGLGLGKAIARTPGFEFLNDGVNGAFPQLGGEGFSGFKSALSLNQLFKAFAFFFGIRHGMLHSFFQPATCRRKEQNRNGFDVDQHLPPTKTPF
jgi:hypothetical protein